jgi:acyl carrier protein phosphodiesterase
MNFLAHTLLSGDDIDIRIGNFLGEIVKGKLSHPRNNYLNERMKIGVALHRHIDSFTDTHPVVKQSLERIHPIAHHYSGVIMDIYYDYLLSKRWDNFSDVPIEDLTQHFYTQVLAYKDLYPDHILPMVSSLTTRNWFEKYQSYEGLQWVLAGLSKRYNLPIDLSISLDTLKKNESLFQAEFDGFFPQLLQTCKTFLV